ncbi:MAG TPA: MOSC N-terminal beta barrel domain-containing protein [Planctomycetota bacterium]|nr:MOSC N-terminal beta barrel domain-containing protein [Planctomycetota bacterium]
MEKPTLARIRIYPIKSLDGVDVESASVLASGALKRDREFAIIDKDDVFVNGKNRPAVHRLRARYDETLERVTLSYSRDGINVQRSFYLSTQFDLLEEWLGRYFGFPVRMRQNWAGGLPDDTDAPGPTIVSTATLETVASWFPACSLESVRRRFRANLEIGGVPAFWEERLYGKQGSSVPFRIGGVTFEGTNPCQRCAVPTRDADTGEVIPAFQKVFMQRRKETLPAWAEASRFNHFYRLAVNTRLGSAEDNALLRVGDPVFT